MKKIKLLFVDYKLVIGGAEQALFDLIHLLDKDKFDITLFVQSPGGDWEERFWKAGVKIVYDYSCRKPTLNPIQKAKNAIKKLQTDAAYKRDGEGLLDVVLEQKPDIIISYSAWGYDQLTFAKNAKSVKYIHGDPGTDPVYREEALQKKDVLRKFRRIVCVSEAAWRSFRDISGLTEGVELHYNPIDRDYVCTLAEKTVDLPEDAPLICAVGRLADDKGFERLVVIHKNLLNQGLFHRLVIVGDGPDRDYLRRIVHATDTQDTVILAGYQSNPYPYMKRSKFLVSSSFAEGLPVIAMEALCLGVPIVSAVPSVGEIFGEETCGIITENDNASLQAGIRKMLTDDAFYATAKAGAENRSTFFDGKRMVKGVEDMFLELMKEP